MPRWLCANLVDLVLDGQLASLEFGDFQVGSRRMRQRFVDLPFDFAMLAVQFRKVGFK